MLPPNEKNSPNLRKFLARATAHINRRDATANTMRVARVCYRGPHASCLIATCSLLILMADAAADSETPGPTLRLYCQKEL